MTTNTITAATSFEKLNQRLKILTKENGTYSQSLNLATVRLGEEIGLIKIQQRYSELMNKPAKNKYHSFLLGAEALAPIEALELYNNFASGGFQTPPKAVIAAVDSSNQLIDQRPFNIKNSINENWYGT